MDPVTIRRATAADIPAAREIIDAAYAKYLSRMDRPPAPMLRELDAHTLWVAGDPVTGLISLIPDDDSLLIENVAVHPRSQGTGLGRRLMEFAEAEAARLGLTRLTLYTNVAMTENQAIYARLGYRETKRDTENGYHRVFMEKPL